MHAGYKRRVVYWAPNVGAHFSLLPNNCLPPRITLPPHHITGPHVFVFVRSPLPLARVASRPLVVRGGLPFTLHPALCIWCMSCCLLWLRLALILELPLGQLVRASARHSFIPMRRYPPFWDIVMLGCVHPFNTWYSRIHDLVRRRLIPNVVAQHHRCPRCGLLLVSLSGRVISRQCGFGGNIAGILVIAIILAVVVVVAVIVLISDWLSS